MPFNNNNNYYNSECVRSDSIHIARNYAISFCAEIYFLTFYKICIRFIL